MQNRSAVRFVTFSLTLVSMLLISGCSSGPNPALNLGGIDIEEVFNGQMMRVQQILGGVNSQATLDKAATDLQTVSYNLDDLIFNSQKLSLDGQTALSMLAMKEGTQLQTLVDEVNRTPAMKEKLGPVMEEIQAKVHQMI